MSRYGGDEFLILINEVREKIDVSLIAEKLLKKFQAPCDMRAGEVTITRVIQASIGIALFPQPGATADSLITGADRAMYVAKRIKSGYSYPH